MQKPTFDQWLQSIRVKQANTNAYKYGDELFYPHSGRDMSRLREIYNLEYPQGKPVKQIVRTGWAGALDGTTVLVDCPDGMVEIHFGNDMTQARQFYCQNLKITIEVQD